MSDAIHRGVKLVKVGRYCLLVLKDDRNHPYLWGRMEKELSIYDIEAHLNADAARKAASQTVVSLDRFDVREDPYQFLIAYYAETYRHFVLCDVGAHYGVTAMNAMTTALSYGGMPKAFAFECGVAGDLTWRNFANNRFDITLEKAAVGPFDGHAIVFSEPAVSVGNRIVESAGSEAMTLPVRCLRLDTYLRQQDAFGPACVKIDTQGAEPGVLAGMAEMMRRAPVAIQLEFTPWAMRQSGKDPAAFVATLGETHGLFSVGFKKHFLREVSSPQAVTAQTDSQPPNWCDLLAVPKSLRGYDDVMARLRAACFSEG